MQKRSQNQESKPKKKRRSQNVEATVEECASDKIVRKSKNREQRGDKSKKELDEGVNNSRRAIATPEAKPRRSKNRGMATTTEEDPPARDPSQNSTSNKDDANYESKFLLEEGHPFLAKHIKSLSLNQMKMLDLYLRKTMMLRFGDKVSTNKDRYTIMAKIAEGRFSGVYLVESKESAEFLALKTELRKADYQKRLRHETEVYLTFEKGGEAAAKRRMHFAKLVDSGRAGDVFFIVIGVVGSTLKKVRNELGAFTKLTCLYVMFHTLKAIRDVHSFNFLHRDIKPSNFCIGFDDRYRRIFLIDFGCAKKIDGKKTKSQGFPCALVMDETLVYASIDIHKGDTGTRRTDLESWIYTCAELFEKNTLPWAEEKSPGRVKKMKENFWKDLGGESMDRMQHAELFRDLISYIVTIRSQTEVDYGRLMDMIRGAIDKLGVVDDSYDPEWRQLKGSGS